VFNFLRFRCSIFYAFKCSVTGMADLRLLVIEKDGSQCQICGIAVDESTAQVDHLKPIRRFKRPIDANTPENLWTLCAKCHMEKTQFDRQMESPLR
jgi:5-methylcytosine-specific restriction endonuclease McrA